MFAAGVLLLGLAAVLAVVSGAIDPQAILVERDALRRWTEAHPVRAGALYVLTYVGVAAVSLPFFAVLSLLGGALFGLWLGTALVSLSSVTGATCALLIVRHGFADLVRRRFGDRLGWTRGDAATTLFWLRLVPIVPFFLVNLGMGLTRIPVFTFVWVSLVGGSPVVILYVDAGRQLDRIGGLGDIVSPQVVLALLALAALPLLAKLLRRRWRDGAPLGFRSRKSS